MLAGSILIRIGEALVFANGQVEKTISITRTLLSGSNSVSRIFLGPKTFLSSQYYLQTAPFSHEHE
jgi:hypothetical protein